jgi:hypothetical protein
MESRSSEQRVAELPVPIDDRLRDAPIILA